VRVSRIIVRNFKRFEEAQFDLKDFNVIVGRNNSGKSTLLQAMSLLQFCIRATLKPRNGGYTLGNVSLGPEEFAVIPVAEPQDLWKDRKTQAKREHIKIELEAHLPSGTQVSFPIDLSYNRFGIQPELRSGTADDLGNLNIAFVPGYAGFLPREERRTPAVRQSLMAQGRHGEIIRNLLFDLRTSEASYQEFLALLAQVFPEIELQPPTFDEKTDLYIHVRYLEEAKTDASRRSSRGFDLISAGSGFHQFLQIFSYVLSTKPTTLLLDEPDAHLFPSLQQQALRLLRALVRDKRVDQVLLATHSPEMISRVPANEILLMTDDAPRSLSQRSDIPSVLQELGSVDNLALLNLRISGRVVMVESREDSELLEQFLRTIWGTARFGKFLTRVVFLPLNGSPLKRDVDSILSALRLVLGAESGLRCFVVGDRDYLLDEQRQAILADKGRAQNQSWIIWERAEIENYLLEPKAIARICAGQTDQPLFDVPEAEITAKLDECIEQSREAALKQIMNQFKEQDRGRETSTCYGLAQELLNARWAGANRLSLCDAKRVALPCLRNWLQDATGRSFTNSRLAAELTPDELPGEVLVVADALLDFAGLR
jgi:predicted ATPase